MRTSRRPMPGLALALALAVAPRVAVGDDVATQARARFERGTELFDEGNLDGALVEFEASFAARAVPVVLFNTAQTYKLMFRYEEAIEAYRRYLSLGGDSIPPERVAEVRTTIERLERSMGTLVVECAPHGASVAVDGRPVGLVPIRSLPLAAGTRRVEVTADGGLPIARDVELAAGETARVCLRPGPAAAAVDARRDRAPVDRRARVEGGGSVFGRWWFWTAAVVVVAAGVAGAVILTAPDEAEPIGGNVNPPWFGAAYPTSPR